MQVIYNQEAQKIELKALSDFDAKQIFTCGQCFRWREIKTGYFRGVVEGRVIDVEQITDTTLVIYRVTKFFFETYLTEYFDLHTNYSRIKEILTKDDPIMVKAVEAGAGIRILNQNPFEMLLTFIISGNNNIPRITKAIETISNAYGTYIETIEGVDYYSFPTQGQLKDVSVLDYRSIGVGYRDKYLYDAVQVINQGLIDLELMHAYEDALLKQTLMTIKGVGSKVADCIILFAYKRKTAFPIDTWVKKIMKRYYVEESAKDREILEYAVNKFGSLAGIAQQYLFYYSRNNQK